MGAAETIDDAIPDDPAPVVQNALREAARALYFGRAPDFDDETIAYLDQFASAVREIEARA